MICTLTPIESGCVRVQCHRESAVRENIILQYRIRIEWSRIKPQELVLSLNPRREPKWFYHYVCVVPSYVCSSTGGGRVTVNTEQLAKSCSNGEKPVSQLLVD